MSIAVPVIEERTSLLLGEKNVVFASFTPVATGNPTLWEAVGLPAGLVINSATGEITGTPTVAGVHQVSLKASNFDIREFTTVFATNLLTADGNALLDGNIVDVLSAGTLPAPLLANTDYEIRDKSGDDHKLAVTLGGAAIVLTDDGTGVHTIRKKQSDEITMVIPILEPIPEPPTDDIGIPINFDIITGAITILGIPDGFVFGPPITAFRSEGLQQPIMRVKQGDRFPVDIGFIRDGVLQDLELGTLKIKAKEFAPDQELTLTNQAWEKQNTGKFTRYRTIMHMEKAVWQAALSNYEQDSDIYFESLAEIEMTVINLANTYDTTLVEVLSPNLGNNDSQIDVLSFSGLPLVEEVSEYSVTVDLAVTGRATQNVSLSGITFDAAFNTGTGVFDVTNIQGTLTGSGATEDQHWTSTVTQTSIVGTANGVDITITTTTSNVIGEFIEIDMTVNPDFTLVGSGVSASNNLELVQYAAGQVELEVDDGGGGNSETAFLDDADDGTDILVTLNSLAAPFDGDVANVLLDVPRQIIIIQLGDPNDWENITDRSAAVGTDPIYSRQDSATISHVASNTVQIIGAAIDDVYRKSSETFILRAERDVIANT